MRVIYVVFSMFLGSMVFIACTEDENSTLGSSSSGEEVQELFLEKNFSAVEISSKDQTAIDANLQLISDYYSETFSDHFLILVGENESLNSDLSCNSHGQAILERMLSKGNPIFLHLADSLEMSPSNATRIEDGRYLNQKYREAPEHIKEAIDFVNVFARNEGALSDDGGLAFNYVDEERGILNGECQNLGFHHLGLFKNTKVVEEMNNAGYGIATWNGVPVYASYTCGNKKKNHYKVTDNGGCKKCSQLGSSGFGWDTFYWNVPLGDGRTSVRWSGSYHCNNIGNGRTPCINCD